MARRRDSRTQQIPQMRANLPSEQPRRETAMSTSDLGSMERRSSDGTTASTDPRSSDGVRTEVTSIMETDPELEPEDETEMMSDFEPDDDENDEMMETDSLYAQSSYPHTLAAHRAHPHANDRSEFDSHTLASTRSLYVQDLNYIEENGRRYCGTYYIPNDEKEQDRLRLLHQVYLHVLDSELTTAPLDDPTAILDIGTGTGDWAIAMGERYPGADVTGVDISAIQDTRVPPNVVFEVDNADEEWDRPPDFYDLIHLRNMIGAFRDWSFIYDQAYLHLKPGGWLEVLDFDDQEGFKKFMSVFPSDSDLHVLARDLAVAAARSGRPRGVAHMDPRLLMEAGFVDIKTTEHIIPINIYEKHRGSAGKIWLAACLTGLEAVCLRPLTQYMGWDPERLKRMCENVAHEMKCLAFDREKSKGLIIKLRILVGRKPPVGAGVGDWSVEPTFVERYDQREGDEASNATGDTMGEALGEATRILNGDMRNGRGDGDGPAIAAAEETGGPSTFRREPNGRRFSASERAITSNGVKDEAVHEGKGKEVVTEMNGGTTSTDAFIGASISADAATKGAIVNGTTRDTIDDCTMEDVATGEKDVEKVADGTKGEAAEAATTKITTGDQAHDDATGQTAPQRFSRIGGGS